MNIQDKDVVIKLLRILKINGRKGVKYYFFGFIFHLYVLSEILALLIRRFLSIIVSNIPAKPMITSVVTLKSCGFFMPAI